MAILLSVTAFMIALTAVWFSSHSMRKMDSHFNEFLKSNINVVRVEIANTAKALEKLMHRVSKIETNKTEENAIREIVKKLEALQSDILKIEDKLPKGPKRQKPPGPAHAEGQDRI